MSTLQVKPIPPKTWARKKLCPWCRTPVSQLAMTCDKLSCEKRQKRFERNVLKGAAQ